MILERINLVPQQSIADKIKQIIPAIILVSLCLIISLIYIENQRVTAELDRLDQKISSFKTTSTAAKQLETTKKKLAAEINLLNRSYSNLKTRNAKIEKIHTRKKPFSGALISIAKSIPPTVKCNKISFSKNRGEISGVTLNYDDLLLAVNQLNQDKRFNNVVLQDINRIKETTRQNFTFSMKFTLN